MAQNGYALEYASEELRGDKEVALIAMAQYGFALRFASENLRGDKEVVLVAVDNQKAALKFAQEDLRTGSGCGLLVYIQGSLQAHDAFMVFLLAARPRPQSMTTSVSRAAASAAAVVCSEEPSRKRRIHSGEEVSAPIQLLFSSLGDDDASAGAAVKQLVAAFMGAQCGHLWWVMRRVAKTLQNSG